MPSVDLTRVGTNIGAMYSLRSLMDINNKLAAAQQRLATGKRINSAQDDPAGMTIASKMNARAIGLGVAQDNISDAKNMLSVAEDGLSKLTDILSTMRSKAQQAASDTLGSEERDTIAGQLQQYARQIDDLVEQTKWNGVSLLDGNVSKQFQTGVDKDEDITWTMNTDLTAEALGVAQDTSGLGDSETLIGGGADGIGSMTANTSVAHSLSKATTGTYTVKVLDRAISDTQGKLNLTSKDSALSAVTLGSGVITDPSEVGELASGAYTLNITNVDATDPAHILVSYNVTDSAGNKVADVTGQDILDGTGSSLDLLTEEGVNGEFTGVKLSFGTDAATDLAIGSSEFEYITSNGAKYQLMDGSGGVMNVDMHETLTQAGTHQAVFSNVASTGAYGYYNMDAAGIVETGRGIQFDVNDTANTSVEDYSKYSILREGAYEVDVSTASSAADYMDVVNGAMDDVNTVLADLGSLMARLSIKEEAAGSARINVESAYNRIMNANMAEEQVNASKYQVLQQTAVAMLAQANQAPQFLLSLFK